MGAEKKKAVVLLSGGLDSTTTLAFACAKGFALYALTVHYGQRHAVELRCAKKAAKRFQVVEHRLVRVPLHLFGGSALTDRKLKVPKKRSLSKIASGIPVTYVPARNTVFLSLALAWAEVLKADAIFLGVNALDYSGYPDCRPAFLRAFERLARLATKEGVAGKWRVKIHAPLLHKTKAEIIRLGRRLGVDFSETSSCYAPRGGRPCGACDACLLRAKGFAEAGFEDPLFCFPSKE